MSGNATSPAQCDRRASRRWRQDHLVGSVNNPCQTSSMPTFTPAEEALLARSERVGALRNRLARLSREEFRELVDALPDDRPERVVARRSAEELASQLGRGDE